MKKVTLFFLCCAVWCMLPARYVEFAVNMNNETINATGIHVTGDFQIAAGFTGGNWNPASTVMTPTGVTGIYHVVVNIPAFHKYEYKYVNGDQFYEVEYVPDESRVGYLFNDNRWFYLDSLSSDTLKMPVLIFSTNAPLNQKLLRYRVGMSSFLVNSSGVHVAGTPNGFDPNASIMYSFDGKIYEHITYVDTLAPTSQYRYVNGNTTTAYETVPASCSTGGNRQITFGRDTVLPVVCFSSCSACVTGIAKKGVDMHLNCYPNPMQETCTISFGNDGEHEIWVTNLEGKVVSHEHFVGAHFEFQRKDLPSGVYFLSTNQCSKTKLIIN